MYILFILLFILGGSTAALIGSDNTNPAADMLSPVDFIVGNLSVSSSGDKKREDQRLTETDNTENPPADGTREPIRVSDAIRELNRTKEKITERAAEGALDAIDNIIGKLTTLNKKGHTSLENATIGTNDSGASVDIKGEAGGTHFEYSMDSATDETGKKLKSYSVESTDNIYIKKDNNSTTIRTGSKDGSVQIKTTTDSSVSGRASASIHSKTSVTSKSSVTVKNSSSKTSTDHVGSDL